MKILFVHKQNETFIRNDLAILKRHHTVTDFQFGVKKIPQLFAAIKNHDMIFIWFISYPAYIISQINKLYKKKLVLIAGGYGVQDEVLKKHRIFKLMVKSALRNANAVFGVSKFNMKEIDKLNSIKKNTKFALIYNGIDLSEFNSGPTFYANARPQVLTVATIFSWGRYYLKGIDKYFEFAKNSLDSDFHVVGINENFINKIKNVPENVTLHGYMNKAELITTYRQADVYCQFSRYESFGMAFLEAIACGCMVFYEPGSGMDEIFANRKNLKMFSLEHRENRLIGMLTCV